MTIWQYCYIFWKAERAAPPRGVLRFCSTDDDSTETFADLCHKLAELGNDGWEAVSHTYIEAPAPGQTFLLKRPLAEDHRY